MRQHNSILLALTAAITAGTASCERPHTVATKLDESGAGGSVSQGGGSGQAGASSAPNNGGNGGAECDGPACCASGETYCTSAESCVDLLEDPRHCGACDSPCGVGEGCVQGQCQPCDGLITSPLEVHYLSDDPSLRDGTNEEWSRMSLRAGDYDGDGVEDLAYTDRSHLIVQLVGPSGLVPQPRQEFESNIRILASADLDDDGIDDLVVEPEQGQNIVLWGSDTGQFVVGPTTLTGIVEPGDFDGDGWLDLAHCDDTLTIVYGGSNREFEPGTPVEGVPSPTQMTAADVDDDGHLDLMLVGEGVVRRYRGDGTGQLTPDSLREVPGLHHIALADLDGNGELDVLMDVEGNSAAEPWSWGRVGLYFNSTQVNEPGIDYYWGASGGQAGPGGAIAARDVDGDGNLDIIANNANTGAVDVLLGHGDGNFSERDAFAMGAAPREMVAVDLNHDGRLDLATINGRGLTVAYNRGGPGLYGQRVYWTSVRPRRIHLADVTADGEVDALVTNSSGDLVLLPGTASGDFGEARHLNRVSDSMASPVTTGDFDGDGEPEIAMQRDRELTILRRTASNEFEPRLTSPWGFQLNSLSAGDLDGDGRTDLVAAQGDPGAILVRLALEGGEFSDSEVYSVGTVLNDGFLSDVDRDGALDVVVVGTLEERVSVLHGSGDGHFGTLTHHDIGCAPVAVRGGDLNQDDWGDIVVTCTEGLVVLPGDPADSFSSPIHYETLGQNDHYNAATIADFDGDGRLDVAIVEQLGSIGWGESYLTILPGHGDGTLGDPVRYPSGSHPKVVAAADLDGSGTPDPVVINEWDHSMTVFLNESRCGGQAGSR